ncbi:MAG: hypothetical protein AB1305_03035, partial [Candidatus Hadarchaeota archaeon]
YGRPMKDEKPETEVLKPKVCQLCALENPASLSFCRRCTAPLDEEISQALQTQQQVSDKVLTTVMEEFMKRAPDLVWQVLQERGLLGVLQGNETPAKEEVGSVSVEV